MTVIHDYNITEYIHCPKYSLCSTYSYPPLPHRIPIHLATSDLENRFHESRNSVSHRNRGDRNRAPVTFRIASSHLITVSRQLAQDLNPWFSLLPVITASSTVWSHFNYFILYLGLSIWSSVKLIHFSILHLPYVRTCVRTEKVLSWQGIFFTGSCSILFKTVSANVSILWKCVHRKIHPIFLSFLKTHFHCPKANNSMLSGGISILLSHKYDKKSITINLNHHMW